MANVLKADKRRAVVAALVEGNSLRATARMTGVARNTVSKLLVDLGYACAVYQDEALRNLPCKRVQADEIWSFVQKKQKNVRGDEEQWVGDVWTFVAICADTKLCVSMSADGHKRTLPFFRRVVCDLKLIVHVFLK